jgi:cytochrome d ubiquinol oxidase subunit II
VPVGDRTGNVLSSWLNPTSILGGVLAVVTCAFLAAVYLTADAERRGHTDLVVAFRRRAMVSAVVAGAVALAGVFVLQHDAPDLFHGLTHRGAPLILLSAVAGITTLVLLVRDRYAWARLSAALAIVAVLFGWAAGQYPYMLEHSLQISDAAGAHATLVAILVSLGVGALLLVPALTWLFVLTQRGTLSPSADH